MKDFEKLGIFYLGKVFDPTKKKVTDDLLLYNSNDLTTHAVCIGMTGSGKTGLGIDIIEEAALDKIPSIIIDPKGDLGNLLLTFPNLSAEEFRPWIDASEAERKNMTVDTYAESVAKNWKEGLASWGEGTDRIKNLRDSVEMVIYTPASNAGIPISILSSFAAPSKDLLLDPTALRDRVLTTTSSLLGLLGINADPIKSREHILISTLFDNAWRNGTDLDVMTLIKQVQKPPFTKIGALDLETVYPVKDRMTLAISLNNLLASPGFQAWMEGEPLNINQMLYTKEGKPKISIISIAHLSDPERMFFVTLFLNQLLSWVRQQEGTSSLRALFYMDEIFGYFPPTAMPPSKTPLLTLLKQARAYGLGLVLCTQNPVDLDYKGLSNCGTWFIGKLQTDRDKARLLEGMSTSTNAEISAGTLDKMIASTGNRVFIMRSVHEKKPILFQTRWTMSYLRGPLTLPQINVLMESKLKKVSDKPLPKENRIESKAERSVLPPDIHEYFMQSTRTSSVEYQPQVVGMAKLHFVDSKTKIDVWEDVCIKATSLNNGKDIDWSQGTKVPDFKDLLEEEPVADSTFQELPEGLIQSKNYSSFEKSFSAWLYQNYELPLFHNSDLNIYSKVGESESDFRIRVSLQLREKRDEVVKKLKESYGQKITVLSDRLKRAQDKLNLKQQKATQSKAETFISIGTTILGTIFGRGVSKGTISQAGTSLRRLGKIGADDQQATDAEDSVQAIQQQLTQLQQELSSEINKYELNVDPPTIKVDTINIKPRKTDISVEKVILVWCPLTAKVTH